MFKDTFEHPASTRPRPLSPTEQTFWRIVRMNSELVQTADTLKQRGQFKAVPGASANYITYQFVWNGQHRHQRSERDLRSAEHSLLPSSEPPPTVIIR